MPIRNVILDLSEVLLTGIKDTGHALGERHGVDLASVVDGPTGSKNPLMLPAVWDFFRGRMTEDEYIAEVVRAYPTFGPHEELKAHIRENFREIEGTRDIVKRLRQLGYRMALLSVHGREWIEHCEEAHDIHSLFHIVAYSYEEGFLKPQPEAFLDVLKRLEALPHECLIVDDSQVNIEAAEALGIPGIRFINAKVLEMELFRLLPDFH